MGILRDIGAPGLIIIVLGAEFKAAVNKTDDDKKDEEDKTKD